jgi:tRNA threonylcarbamoyladenosine biosynthesis protein TsaB
MLILVLDSCGYSCGVGVFREGAALSRESERMERGQDARLIPMVVAALEQAKCEFSDLDRVAVTRGPGSFTGVRIGLATARGIGFAAGKPVVGIDRFSIYKSHRATAVRNLLVVIDSKRAELFCKFFPQTGKAHDACMMTEKQIREFMDAHPDTEIAGDMATPDVDILAACAQLAVLADASSSDFLPRPLYLRSPDVTFAVDKS